MAAIQALSIKPSSLDRLEATVNSHILSHVGSMPCNDFTEDVFVNEILQPIKASGLSFSSMKKAQDTICAFCKWASARPRRYMAYNPMEGFEKISKSAMEKDTRETDNDPDSIVFIEKDDREQFLASCRAMYKNGNARFKYGEHYIFMMYTGLRMGEMIALRWKDIDFEKKTVRVCANAYMIKDRDTKSDTFGSKVLTVFPYTKTNKPRTIPLGNQAFEAASRIFTSRHTDSEFVACNVNGDPVLPSVFSVILERVFNLAGIKIRKGTNVHALRHTFASMCFAAGMNVRVVSELLGHSSVQITMDTYIHLISEINLDTIPELEDLR